MFKNKKKIVHKYNNRQKAIEQSNIECERNKIKTQKYSSFFFVLPNDSKNMRKDLKNLIKKCMRKQDASEVFIGNNTKLVLKADIPYVCILDDFECF